MGSILYQECAPPPQLQPWVRRMWSYEDANPSGILQRIPPDGCPELIIHLGDPYEEEREAGVFERQPRVIFAGQMTRPLCLRASGPVVCAGLRFEPDGAAGWFGSAMKLATDLRMDATGRIDASNARDLEAAISLLQDLVGAAIAACGSRLDPEIRADVRRQQEGAAPAAPDPAERRRMQRLYLKLVGVPPQMLQSIFRFRRVFDRAAEANGGSWLNVALDAGYFDQPQMARDFRRFLGCTATEWAKEQIEIGRAVASYPARGALATESGD
jgi:AraC-like DNA-binding protein